MNNMEEKCYQIFKAEKKKPTFSSSDPSGLIMLHGFDITESTPTQTGNMRVTWLI